MEFNPSKGLASSLYFSNRRVQCRQVLLKTNKLLLDLSLSYLTLEPSLASSIMNLLLYRAQDPFLFSHAWNFKNDCDRLKDISQRVNISPLGSGALAGNPFRIDRTALARDMGFDGVTCNSMQAVGDRDFVGKHSCNSEMSNTN